MSMIMIRSKILIFGMFILVFHYLLTLGKSQITSSPIGLPPPVSNLIFGDQRLALVYPVIQNFKSLITLDPLNITASWIGSDVCNYKGFYCEDPPDNKSAIALASIDFNGFQLTAPTLEGFLDQLPDLAIFHANSNNFGGPISPNIAKLPYLYELDISNNRFTGPFPSAVLGMIDLSFLDIRFNSFSGTVPPEIFDKDLDVLFINNNNFMTRLPDRITSITTHIVYLTLSNNEFFGPIPRNIAKVFANVTEILIQNNLLTGCLPYELGLLKEVVVFDAGNNRLTGSLPWSLGCLQKLEVMNFAGNLLYGAVPEVLCGVGSLGNLTLSDNYFSRVGPVCWGLIKSGVLDVKKNCIPGLPFQRSVAECALFFAQPRHYCPYMPNYGPRFFPCWFHFKSSYELAPAPH